MDAGRAGEGESLPPGLSRAGAASATPFYKGRAIGPAPAGNP